ncbi:DNA-binding protein [Pseudomonas mandelii]|uniref:DNA-binding protein n=1 Tax=Pseudomonas mandelii TaxID=75612 RepID=A0AB36D104_9PSED|nr:DNA-binding protein [Pseudomonas mandelii]NMZ81838.1 DNA-binding protein [Pseudomonas mandelii]
MQALLTVDQLSVFLQKSVASIRSDVTRNPQALPPICRLPGTKRLLWRVEDVEAWLAKHVVGSEFVKSGAEHERARMGRPTKAVQIAKQRSFAK